MLPRDIRNQFPLLSKNPDLVYLDSAATAQKPSRVIEAVKKFYEQENANIHRGVYKLSSNATELYEASREQARHFLNASKSEEIVFVSGATEGMNLIAQAFGKMALKEGDEILLAEMEHHSNIIPWQLLCEQIGSKIKVIPLTEEGELDLSGIDDLLSTNVKLLSLTHASNAIGTINPIKKIISKARAKNIPVVVDGAQAVSHLKVDVQDLDCDFYVFSGHKVYGPTGTGILYGKAKQLNKMPPYKGGGDMILSVSFEGSTYMDPPQRFEAGTSNIAGILGLAEALRFIEEFGWGEIAKHEQKLISSARSLLSEIKNLRVIGFGAECIGVLSFVMENAHPHDIGTILDSSQIAIRTGHHCCQPLMNRFKIPATARASFGIYNSEQDLSRLKDGLEKVCRIFCR